MPQILWRRRTFARNCPRGAWLTPPGPDHDGPAGVRSELNREVYSVVDLHRLQVHHRRNVVHPLHRYEAARRPPIGPAGIRPEGVPCGQTVRRV